MRTAFGVRLAAEALAEAAVLARAEFGSIGIGVGARGVRRRARKRIVSHAARGGVEELRGITRLERRQRIFVGARRFERIAAFLYLAAQVAGFAGDARGALELFVIRFQFGVCDAPVLDRHVFGNVLLAVLLFVQTADFEF